MSRHIKNYFLYDVISTDYKKALELFFRHKSNMSKQSIDNIVNAIYNEMNQIGAWNYNACIYNEFLQEYILLKLDSRI